MTKVQAFGCLTGFGATLLIIGVLWYTLGDPICSSINCKQPENAIQNNTCVTANCTSCFNMEHLQCQSPAHFNQILMFSFGAFFTLIGLIGSLGELVEWMDASKGRSAEALPA